LARPKKQTVDYFPHYCNHKKTIYILEQRYGNDGYAFWFKLLELLGDSEGHYLDLNDDSAWEFLQAKTRIENDTCKEILALLARINAIDSELWDNKIVWSQNFVDGIADAYRNRRVDIPTKPHIYSKKPEQPDISTTGNPHTKLNETKLNETKREGIPPKKEIEYDEIKNTWNEFATELDLPTVKTLTDKRRAGIRNRLRSADFNMAEVLSKIRESQFLLGDNNRGWKVSFDFIFCTQDKYIEILEGKYAGTGRNGHGKRVAGNVAKADASKYEGY
jgi:hypothetical protein